VNISVGLSALGIIDIEENILLIESSENIGSEDEAPKFSTILHLIFSTVFKFFRF